jgi:ATP/maltotriose-dependent transcriptional regulator MalT
VNRRELKVIHPAQRDEQAYALAYVERCRGFVPLLESERELLLRALEKAWQREQYAQVVQLVSGLVYLVGRLDNREQGRGILQRGIQACQRLQNRYQQAYFLNRLSTLLWLQGEYTYAQRVWEESRQIAQALGRTVCLWEPFFSLIPLADMLGGYDAAAHLVTSLLHNQEDYSESIAAVRFIRAFYARLHGNKEQAQDDLVACLSLLSVTGIAVSPYKPFFELLVKVELARVRDDYDSSRVYAQAALSFAQTCCDRYTIAALLWDQCLFAYHCGLLDDAYPFVLQLVKLTEYRQEAHFRRWTAFLLQQFGSIPPSQRASTTMICASQSPYLLSYRELDILHLLASGASNREIATALTIATGTVKKHIEHIYDKLDAHSRTQAVAIARSRQLL